MTFSFAFLPNPFFPIEGTAIFSATQYAAQLNRDSLFNINFVNLFSILRVGLSLLFLSLVLPHGGELTRLLHRVAASYLLFHLFIGNFGSVIRFEDASSLNTLLLRQSDSVFPRLFHFASTALLIAFFYGIAERFFLARRGEREYPLLLVLLHIGGLRAIRVPNLIEQFLSIERFTLASYALLSAERQSRFSTYAGVQAFLLGSVPSVRFLLGFALLYLQSGSLALSDLDRVFGQAPLVAESTQKIALVATSSIFASYITQPYRDFSEFGDIFSAETFFPSETIHTLFSFTDSVVPVSLRALLFILFNILFKRTAAPFHV